LKEEGLSQQLAEKLLQKSVKLATEARTIFLGEQVKREGHQFLQPIIAGSIGPYGAYLADGSEYTGDYSITNEALYDFHYRRMEIISNAGVDLLACETIPNVQEARVLDNIIRKLKFPAWISFSCRDSERIHDGTRISECAELLEDNSHIIGIGVNCTAPGFVEALIGDLVKTTSKYIIAYPNSGEIYKPDSKTWEGSTEADYFCNLSKSWKSKGAVILGGCCRTSPRHIRLMHRLLLK